MGWPQLISPSAAKTSELGENQERVNVNNPLERRVIDKFGLAVVSADDVRARAEAVEVRASMTAKDASTAFGPRRDVRGAILAFIRAEMPEAIVHYRGDLGFRQPQASPT